MPKRFVEAASPRFFLLFALCFLSGPLALAPAAHAQASDQAVYTDSPQSGWVDNYSWASINDANPRPVHSGSASISVTAASYTALYFHHDAQDSTPYAGLSFWINGGATGGQTLQVEATRGGSPQQGITIGPLAANTWQHVTLSLGDLDAAYCTDFDGFWIWNATGTNAPSYFVDDITLIAGTVPTVSYPSTTVTVNAGANRHAISPLVYGVNYGNTVPIGTSTALSDLNAPLNRYGGNNTSRYNWQINADNKGSDYYFESYPDLSATPGERVDTFFSDSKTAGAQALITIPMIDWIAKLGANRNILPSFSVAKYGAQSKTDPYFPDAGNGLKPDGKTPVAGNDPNDANTPNSTAIEQSLVQHLVTKWGAAAAGGVKYYVLDNEPSLWSSTHRDVHPSGPGMDEVLNKMLSYAVAIKAADPSALTVGPEEWGWDGYFYSGADQQVAASLGYDTTKYPDRKAHGGMDYIPYLLQQIHQHDQSAGTRSLDVLSVHFYPQGGEGGSDTPVTTQQLRNRSTRQLWDPNYTSESYINNTVMLIPRLKGWVNTYDPGLQTALTEYNWGGETHINGATTQADIFGIFGREGLDMATRWTIPTYETSDHVVHITPTYNAMKLYRNYDGKNSAFGETSVSDTAPDPDNLSSFAAVRASDGALTVMVIGKTADSAGVRPVTINLANFSAGASAQVWQLDAHNAITQLANVPVSNGSLTTTIPAQSVTLFVIPALTDVTSLLRAQSSGLVYVRRTQIFAGNVTLTNTSSQPVAGPFQVIFKGLPSGQTLVAGDGTYQGDPYVTANIPSLAPGASTRVTTLFRNSTTSRLSYTIQVLSGSL